METLLYLGKASVGMIVLYAIYWFLLQKHTYFAFNRFYLLIAMLTSLLAPWVVLPEEAPEVVPAISLALEPTTLVFQPTQQPLLTSEEILLLCYVLGVLAMLGRLGVRLWQLVRIVKAGQKEQIGSYTLVRLNDKNIGSFSFLNYLIINQQDAESLEEVVLRHELVHIQQHHSWDLLWAEIVQIFWWFNPVLIFYKRSLKEIHEFIADEKATNGDRLHYARTLAGYALGVSPQLLTNNFFDIKQLKNRIAMLTKNRSSRWVLGRYLLALPVVVGLVVLVAARSADPNALTFSQAADEITIKGRVVTADGKGLPGATVLIVNTSSGTTTDVNGHYTLKVARGKQLAISFVGYKMQVVEAFYPDLITTMYPEPKKLSEVVVIGYGASTTENTPNTKEVTSASIKEEKVFTVVEQNPEFPGGVNELQRFLARNIKYPSAAARANVQGKVFVQFVVGTDGQVREANILKGLGFGCDEEALRLMSMMPQWKPGIQNGKNVAVQYNLPIVFVLEKRIEGVTQEVDLKELEIKYRKIAKDETIFLLNNGKVISDKNTGGDTYETNTVGIGALYFINGNEVSLKMAKAINPSDIESINVIKADRATAIYGDKGKEGVIFITTKDYAKASKSALPKEALYVIDGKEASLEIVQAIDPNHIDRVDVLKGEAATQKYGDKAKQGVVEITLKKKN